MIVFLSKQKLPIKLTLTGAWGVIITQLQTIRYKRETDDVHLEIKIRDCAFRAIV